MLCISPTGAAFICPEYRYLMAGVDKADSFNFNPHKWMLVNFDCSAMWLKDPMDVVNSFNVDPLYLKHDHQGDAPDYRHWQIPLGRRFRALKLWFVLRLYGVEGLQKHIRSQIALAHEFADLVSSDPAFELVTEVSMGLVCFRLKSSVCHLCHQSSVCHLCHQSSVCNLCHQSSVSPLSPVLRVTSVTSPPCVTSVTSPSCVTSVTSPPCGEDAASKRLLERLTARRKVYMIPATVRELFVLRFVVCSRLTESRDVRFAWDEVKTVADEVLGVTTPIIPYSLPRSTTDTLDCHPIIPYKVPQSNTGAVKLMERGGVCFQDEVNANNCQL
uniref:Dopa decarboxylase n=1 Tax=Timema cristinae TaxID=61476 RepID=A0A7R9D0L3_TIMCR|nr:unnamed protein product [Timema cristinae]